MNTHLHPVARRILRGLLPACVALAFVSAAEALGCPTCKDSLAEGDETAANLARGYFYSILLMLGMPFTLASSFGLYMWRELRRARHQAESGGVPVPDIRRPDHARDGLP